MKNIFLLLILVFPFFSLAQDTFSIVAIDSITGEIGSAGASCVPISLPVAPHGALIISDILPGIGAIHTQAYWLAVNQQNARTRMLAGDSAQQIITWLTLNDAQSNSTIRQYGIVEAHNGHPESAAFTGTGCNDYKNHITGPGYSIQGNILLGQHILDSMEAHYLNTSGSLAQKLMAALQGANVVGADTRCGPFGLSSLSSFIRVAAPGDTNGTFHLDLNMAYPSNTSYPVDPIDSLQTLFNNWLADIPENFATRLALKIMYTNHGITIQHTGPAFPAGTKIELIDSTGKLIFKKSFQNKITLNPQGLKLSKGLYFFRILDGDTYYASGKLIF